MRPQALLSILILLLSVLPAGALTINEDTDWHGEIALNETVRVAADAVLSLAPKTRVTFSGGGLVVDGTLLAEDCLFTGTGWKGIELKGKDKVSRLTGVTIEGADIGLHVSGAPVLDRLTFRGNRVGMELRRKSAAAISDSLFTDNTQVGLFIKDGSTPKVTDCRFEKNGRFGAYIFRANPALFYGNAFTGNPTGLTVSQFGSDPKIAGNGFFENEVGILVDRAAKPTLSDNLLRGNATAMRLYRRSDPLVERNHIEDNKIGISVAYSSYPRIEGNYLTGNGTALLLEYQSSVWERERGTQVRQEEASSFGAFGRGSGPKVTEEDRRPRNLDGFVDARGNWWGPEGSLELTRIGEKGNPSFLHDGRDTPTFTEGGREYPLDKVLFAPWSLEPAITNPGKMP